MACLAGSEVNIQHSVMKTMKVLEEKRSKYQKRNDGSARSETTIVMDRRETTKVLVEKHDS